MFWKDPILWNWIKFEKKDNCEYDKCPNCDELSFFNWKCSNCWLWRWDEFKSKKEEIKLETDEIINKKSKSSWKYSFESRQKQRILYWWN
jgi:hypothetical protein